jgi:hypothetical protein
VKSLSIALVDACRRGPGEKRLPGALVGREAVNRKVSPARPFEKEGKKPTGVARRERGVYIFPKHAAMLYSWYFYFEQAVRSL